MTGWVSSLAIHGDRGGRRSTRDEGEPFNLRTEWNRLVQSDTRDTGSLHRVPSVPKGRRPSFNRSAHALRRYGLLSHLYGKFGRTRQSPHRRAARRSEGGGGTGRGISRARNHGSGFCSTLSTSSYTSSSPKHGRSTASSAYGEMPRPNGSKTIPRSPKHPPLKAVRIILKHRMYRTDLHQCLFQPSPGKTTPCG